MISGIVSGEADKLQGVNDFTNAIRLVKAAKQFNGTILSTGNESKYSIGNH